VKPSHGAVIKKWIIEGYPVASWPVRLPIEEVSGGFEEDVPHIKGCPHDDR
jgi:hypothetical protein